MDRSGSAGKLVGVRYNRVNMRWRMFHKRELLEMGERARRSHSAWLTRHLDATPGPPRIPVRRVSRGGFGSMMDRPQGPGRAERWWRLVFERVELEED